MASTALSSKPQPSLESTSTRLFTISSARFANTTARCKATRQVAAVYLASMVPKSSSTWTVLKSREAAVPSASSCEEPTPSEAMKMCGRVETYIKKKNESRRLAVVRF